LTCLPFAFMILKALKMRFSKFVYNSNQIPHSRSLKKLWYQQKGIFGSQKSEFIEVPSPFKKYGKFLSNAKGIRSIAFGTFNLGFFYVLSKVEIEDKTSIDEEDAKVELDSELKVKYQLELKDLVVNCELIGDQNYVAELYGWKDDNFVVQIKRTTINL